MKSYQFFKICKHFDKEREKTLGLVNEKRKTEKSWTFFIAGCSIKSFNWITNHLFVSQSHSQSNFCLLILG